MGSSRLGTRVRLLRPPLPVVVVAAAAAVAAAVGEALPFSPISRPFRYMSRPNIRMCSAWAVDIILFEILETQFPEIKLFEPSPHPTRTSPPLRCATLPTHALNLHLSVRPTLCGLLCATYFVFPTLCDRLDQRSILCSHLFPGRRPTHQLRRCTRTLGPTCKKHHR